MKVIKYFRLMVPATVVFLFAAAVAAQDGRPADGQSQDQRPAANQPQDIRANVLRQLGLSREQIQQIRRMNIERKPMMDDAQKRFREANQALDQAIYADNINETDVQARLKEVQLAQAEVAKIRYMNELAVRRILTPEQLIRFRELRQRFEQARQNFERRRDEGQRPANDAKTPQDGSQPVQRFVRPDRRRPQF